LEISAHIFAPYERLIVDHLVFPIYRYPCKNGWWRTSLLSEILAETDPPSSKTPISNQEFARSASASTPSEKSSSNTNRKSTTGFPRNLRWTTYVTPMPPKKAHNAKWPFFLQNLHNNLR